MKSVLKRTFPFLVPYLLLLMTGAYFLLTTEKTPFHRTINRFNTPFLDEFLKVFTHAGDFVFCLLVVVALAFVRLRPALILAIASVSSSLLAQFLKRVIFPDADRPIKHLYDFPGDFHFVPGVEVMWNHSFPSGHTVSAFTTFFCLAWVAGKAGWQGLCLIVALMVAWSRVYLSQHYLEDVYFGSLLGVFTAFLTVFLTRNWEKQWMNKGLRDYFRLKEEKK